MSLRWSKGKLQVFIDPPMLPSNSVGVEDHCSSFFFPDDLEIAPWGPQVGLMPVILLDY